MIKGKILFAGGFGCSIYEEACIVPLEEIGYSVSRFKWNRFYTSLLGKVELKYSLQLSNSKRMNNALLNLVKEVIPDILVVWRGTNIFNSTIIEARKYTKIAIVSYCNDNPFSEYFNKSTSLHHRRLWKNFKNNIPHYDINFVYRPANLLDYENVGSSNTHILPPYFLNRFESIDHISTFNQKRDGVDIVFIGHYEPDLRLNCITTLVDLGYNVKLYGTGWTPKILGDYYDYFGNVFPVYNKEYKTAISSAKICLSFFSKLNRDVYTRRTFEITALGTLMLSEYSKEVNDFFADSEDAVYFNSVDELKEKVRWLLNDEKERKRIAQNGRNRCINDGHDIKSRMKYFVGIIEKYANENTLDS